MVNALETLLQQVVDITILLFEFMGVLVIIAAGLRGIYDYVKRNPSIRLNLAQGMALRTVVVRQLSEVAVVAAIIALRAALTFLIHWEIKVERESE